ncbi:DegT/DnrJ/EryC1/StrS family aminotransferase [Treponema phagedenis]|uniref:DegT/DnrJ/EryC1/StrS family aminotransferase n=1 Tax=Treponema phagedenis TaxID=162 RepID=A0AAE6IU98_TREPH|nr:DegT/DnrJ/EryC1/StrS family aminotransferase [Treponema phagedenis]NVP23141.1 DegT/DnrJ/EryC1/StrS family aminotransferase [Treponema phagedenis]QEJ95406.1 DegT/DnrJ/EryC1/StrS family aminotransferase [Treponema phagedenis]QEJ98051.1 DegT/DnrJ/EryC1/StrS family aminotransferase [Treponema phagedenis]QEK01260.1 DegT/DnrJ/EryC1/StrS family aminotransferase [Treponema phagedenis]QEK06279.1 DegT/DnrJ/EryC1/StrS family aminotransferase [Treponema phagedenis]
MNVPFYTSTREYQNYKQEFDSAISSVLETGDFILGKAVTELEQAVAKYCGVKYAVGVANGSDALVIASDILGFKDGAEVLTPVFTFFASTSCIARLGGKPVFCDVDEDTFCIDMNDAENRITKNTIGILPVHLFLQTADMEACMNLAKKHNLKVLEDAAEAFGMQDLYKGQLKTSGTIGDIGIYSFFPTKTLGGYGDGGMIVTNNEEYYTKAKSLRVHGATKKYHHDYIGYNSRLDSLQAAILNVKLNHIDDSIQKRAKHAQQYRELLNTVSQVQLPKVKTKGKEVYYVFNLLAEKRDELQNFLQEKGIGTTVYYPKSLHEQECFKYLGYKKGDFPVAEKLCASVLALPMYPELTEDEVSYTCECIKKFYQR